jgi:hypothetical protein
MKYLTVNSYSQQTFDQMPVCFAGYMIREKANQGKIFEAKTVKDRFDIKSKTKISIPFIFDIQENKVMRSDISFTKAPIYNNVESTKHNVIKICKVLSQLSTFKPTVFKLAALHAAARSNNIVVDNIKIKNVKNTYYSYKFIMDKIGSSFDQELSETYVKFDVKNGTYNLYDVEKIISNLL